MNSPRAMRAAVLVEPKRFELREVSVPDVGPGDALIRVERSGICGTDIHIFNGHYAADRLPLTPGHEFVGTIAALGRDAKGLREGDRAVVDINIGCGHCFYCRKNEVLNCPDMRQIGISRDGAFADYVAAPARLVLPVEGGVPPEALALVEPVACVVRAARKARVRFGQSVVVLGAGPVGNLHVQMMRLVGAAPIVAVELSPERAELARRVGADVVVTDPATARETVLGLTEGRGADVVIESVGLPKLYAQALTLLRPGGHLAAFGIAGPDDALALPLLDTVLKEYGLKGSVAGMGEDMIDALTLVRHNRFDLTAFTGSSFPLDRIQDAFDTLAARPGDLKTQIAIA